MPEEVPEPATELRHRRLVSPVSAEVGQRVKTASPTRVAVRAVGRQGWRTKASGAEVGLVVC